MVSFLVGIFPFDNTVDIIRESWLCGFNDRLQEVCKYPCVNGDKKKLEQILHNCTEPEDTWQEYVIIPKRAGIESYAEAVRIQKMLQEDEDGATTDPDKLGRGFRFRKRNQIFESSDEEIVPKTKKVKVTKPKQQKEDARRAAQKYCSASLTDFTIPNCKSFRMPSPIPNHVKPRPVLKTLNKNPSSASQSQKALGFAQSTQKGFSSAAPRNFSNTQRKPLANPQKENHPTNNIPQNRNSLNERPAAAKNPQKENHPTNNIPQNRNSLNERPAAANINGNRPRISTASQIVRNLVNPRPAAGNINGNRPGTSTVNQISNAVKQRPKPVNINKNQSLKNNIPPRNEANQNQHNDLPMILSRVEGKLDQFLEKIDLLTSATQRCNKKLTGVKLAVDGNGDVLKDLQLKMSSLAIAEVCNLTDEVKQRFPVKSIADLELLDEDLCDPDFRKKCVAYFSKLSTNCINDSVRKIAKEMMTDELASKYSWTGRTQDSTGKLALTEHQMFISVLQESVRVTHDVTHEQVKKPFSRWLVLAKDRLGDQGCEDEGGEAMENVNETEDGNEDNLQIHGFNNPNENNGEFENNLGNEDQAGSGDNSQGDGFDSPNENYEELDDNSENEGQYGREDNSQRLSFDYQNGNFEEFDTNLRNDDQDQEYEDIFNDDATWFSGAE